MDYKPSKQIHVRTIRKLHTCKNLYFNCFRFIQKIIIRVLICLNSSEKLRETDFDRQIKVITFLEETSRNFIEKHREISRRRFCLPGLFRCVSPRNKNFAFAMVAEEREICCFFFTGSVRKVQVGNDQEKAQSEKDSHSKNRGGKNKLTIRYLYHGNIS